MTEIELQRVLENCRLHPLLLITEQVLGRVGYGDVKYMGRWSSAQKSRHGGYDIICKVRLGTSMLTTVVKVIAQDSVHLRMVSEMWGTVHLAKADLGLIISPMHVAKNARDALRLFSPRVQVLDGLALAEILCELRIGVHEGRVDYEYFSALEPYCQWIRESLARKYL